MDHRFCLLIALIIEQAPTLKLLDKFLPGLLILALHADRSVSRWALGLLKATQTKMDADSVINGHEAFEILIGRLKDRKEIPVSGYNLCVSKEIYLSVLQHALSLLDNNGSKALLAMFPNLFMVLSDLLFASTSEFWDIFSCLQLVLSFNDFEPTSWSKEINKIISHKTFRSSCTLDTNPISHQLKFDWIGHLLTKHRHLNQLLLYLRSESLFYTKANRSYLDSILLSVFQGAVATGWDMDHLERIAIYFIGQSSQPTQDQENLVEHCFLANVEELYNAFLSKERVRSDFLSIWKSVSSARVPFAFQYIALKAYSEISLLSLVKLEPELDRFVAKVVAYVILMLEQISREDKSVHLAFTKSLSENCVAFLLTDSNAMFDAAKKIIIEGTHFSTYDIFAVARKL